MGKYIERLSYEDQQRLKKGDVVIAYLMSSDGWYRATVTDIRKDVEDRTLVDLHFAFLNRHSLGHFIHSLAYNSEENEQHLRLKEMT